MDLFVLKINQAPKKRNTPSSLWVRPFSFRGLSLLLLVGFFSVLIPQMNAQGLVIEEDLILKDAPVPSIVEFADLQEASLAVSAADEIAIYPNPAKSGDFVTIEGTQKIYTILLMDSNAKVLAKWKDGRDTKVRIALPQLRSGMYFISVGTKEGVFTESLSIQ